MNNLNAYLEILIGPINFPKELCQRNIYNKFKSINKYTVLINHTLNSYSYISLQSNKNNKFYYINTLTLIDLYSEYISCDNEFMNNSLQNKLKIQKSSLILIDNAHIYTDLVPFVNLLLKDKKHIYIFGLSDIEQKKIGNILDLVPLCDKIVKITTLCQLCKNGEPGIFSKYLMSTDNYISLCRSCLEKKLLDNNILKNI